MSDSQTAFQGTTVVSTRKDSAIEGAIVRRRQRSDGERFTTYEIDESKAEMLLSIPGGLVRRHTAINPDNIAKAIDLSKSGKTRVQMQAELGVSSSTFRRLLEAGGISMRSYTQVLTEDNVTKALKSSVKYDIRKRGDIIRASKEVGVDSRTLRRLLSKAFELFTPEQIGTIRNEETQRLATPEGQKEIEMSKEPVKRKPRKATVADNKDLPDGPDVASTKDMPVDENTPAVVKDAVARGDDHSGETGLANSPLVPVTPHAVVVADKPGYGPTVIEQGSQIDNAGTSLHEPHGHDGSGNTDRDAAANAVATEPVVDAANKPMEMSPPVQPVDALDRTRPNIVPGGTTVEPIGAVSDVDEQKAKGLFQPMRDGVIVATDPGISEGNPEQYTADQAKMAEREEASKNPDADAATSAQAVRGDLRKD